MCNMRSQALQCQGTSFKNRSLASRYIGRSSICSGCSSRRAPPPLGLDLRCRSRPSAQSTRQQDGVRRKRQVGKLGLTGCVQQIDEAATSTHALSPPFLSCSSLPCLDTYQSINKSPTPLKLSYVAPHGFDVGSPIESPLTIRTQPPYQAVVGHLNNMGHRRYAEEGVPDTNGQMCNERAVATISATPSLTTVSLDAMRHRTHGVGGEFCNEEGKYKKNSMPKPSAGQFLDCGHSDVTSESATDGMGWNMDGQTEVDSRLNGGEILELDMLGTGDVVASTLDSNVNISGNSLFPESSPECGELDDLLMADVMGVPVTISEDGGDMTMSLLDGFLQSF